MSESEIQQEVQIEARRLNTMLLRNNNGAFTDSTGRTVRYGLGNISKKHSETMKSSDLIGFRKMVVTPEMVGQTIAVFTAIEMKSEDWKSTKKLDEREIAQKNFIDLVKSWGGIASFCNSVDQLKTILGHL